MEPDGPAFQEDYAREKDAAGDVLDFSDLEHLSLRSCSPRTGTEGPARWPGTGAPGSPR
ncbi:MAG: hypothetical protein ACLUJG_01470 [Lawsonibacter sp.]